MTPYLVTFTSSFFVAWMAEKKIINKKNKIFSISCLIFAMILLSILAALRGDTIGTDIKTYVIKYFDEAGKYDSFISYLSCYPSEYVEPGYKLFTFVISRFTNDLRFLHFTICVFELSFVCAYLWENRQKMSISIGLLVFMLMQYNICFNAIRQSMAVCICLYSFNAARDRNLKKFIILMLAAMSFHRSSLLMVISYPLAIIFNKCTIREKTRLIWILALMSVFVLTFINTIVAFFINSGVFPVKFSHYIGERYSVSRLSALFFAFPAILIFILYKKNFYKIDSFNAVLVLYIVLWPILAQLDSVSDQFGRMAFFFNIANIGFYSQLPAIQKLSNNKFNFLIIRPLVAVFLIIYWYVSFNIWGVGETIPYMISF